MARCPFAVWQPFVFGGTYTGGPWKIVHHTTESSSTVGSIHELHVKHVEAHFVVDNHNVWQLIDTKYPARSLRNKPGGVQTNRDHAIQIEMVGFAGKPKDVNTLMVMRKLLRWIEVEHGGIPRTWPNGYPKPPTKSGKDPGGHNRNALYWATKGGHYGHSQVPENIHWDPAYSEAEVNFLMSDPLPIKEIQLRRLLLIPALAFTMMAATCSAGTAQDVVDLVKKNCGIAVAVGDVAAAMSAANPVVVGVQAIAHAICSQAQHDTGDSGMIVRVQDADQKGCVAVVNGVCIRKKEGD